MSLCPLSRILAPLALAAIVVAGVARAEVPAKPEQLVHKVYRVADLVVPIPGMTTPAAAAVDFAFPLAPCSSKPCCAEKSGCCAEKPTVAASPCTSATATCEQHLMKLIRTSIASDSWAGAGGPGTIEYMPIGMAIVVTQTPEVQEQVAELLDSLRRAQDLQVAVEFRVMSVGDCLFGQIAEDFGLLRQPTTLLDGCGMARFIERVQGDRRTNVMQAPKLTTFSGQEATIRAGDEQFFVTGLSLAQSRGQTVFVPQNQPYWTGLTMTVQPTLTPDRHTVVLKLQAELAEMQPFPVTMFISPFIGGGTAGQPIPIQQPTIMKRGITKVLGIPDGHTAVFSAGRGTRTVVDVDYCPVLGHIPFVCELFKTETPRQESDHLIFLVTPRVIVNCEHKACAEKADERKCGVASECRPTPNCAAPAVQASPAPCPVAAPVACTAEQLPMPVVRPMATPVLSCPAAAACVAEQPVVRVMPTPTIVPVRDQVEGILQNQVRLDVVLLDLEDGFFERPEGTAWADLAPKSCTGKPLAISPEVADRFCTSARQLNAAKILAWPKFVTMDGKPVTFHCGGYQAIPEVTATGAGGEIGARYEPFGTLLNFRPVVCPADVVKLEVECNLSKLSDAKGFNINGKRVAGRDTHQMTTCADVAPGRTIVMHVGPGETPGSTKMLLLTPSVIHPNAIPMPLAPPSAPTPVYAVSPVVLRHMPIGYPVPPAIAEEQVVPPPPPVDPKLARLMRRYQEACAEGRTSAAKKLAAKCLEIDPTCFGRD